MENPEKTLSRELAGWLKYYRQLGFTHLYLRGAGSSDGENRAESPAGQAAVTESRPNPIDRPLNQSTQLAIGRL